MSLNGTSSLINSKIVHSKKRGRAFVEELNREYGNEEVNARSIEGSKKPHNYAK